MYTENSSLLGSNSSPFIMKMVDFPTNQINQTLVRIDSNVSRFRKLAQPHCNFAKDIISSSVFFNHLIVTLKERHQSFLDFSTLAIFSETNHAIHDKCQEIWLAFASPSIFRLSPLTKFLPKDFGHNHEKVATFLHALGHASDTGCVNLLRVICASDQQFAVRELHRLAFTAYNESTPSLFNDLKAFCTLMKAGVDVQERDQSGTTVLMIAASKGHFAVIHKVFKNLDQQIKEQTSPLATALKREEIVNFIESSDHEGRTALMIAKERVNQRYYNCLNDLKTVDALLSMSPLSERITWNLSMLPTICKYQFIECTAHCLVTCSCTGCIETFLCSSVGRKCCMYCCCCCCR